MNFKNFRFQTKLYLGFTFVIFSFVAISIIGIVNLESLQDKTELIYKHPLRVGNAVRDINISIYGMQRSMTDLVSATNKQEIDSIILEANSFIEKAQVEFKIVFERFKGDLSNVEDAYACFKESEKIRKEVAALKFAGKDKEAAHLINTKGAKHMHLLLAKTKVMSDFATSNADKIEAESEKTYKRTFSTILFLIVLFLALSVLIIIVVSTSILSPIKKFITDVRGLYTDESDLINDIHPASEVDLLLITASELKSAYEQIEDANVELNTLNVDLDEKVKIRTAELEENNLKLKEKNEEYLAINEEYETLNVELTQTNEELILAKEEIEESKTRFEALHNASFGGITIHDKGVIIESNQGLSDISGYSYEELVGMDSLLLIAEDSRERVIGNIKSEFEEPYEAIGLRKNGKEYPLRLEAKMIPYKGKKVRVVEFRDITEQKLAEEKLIKAHEFLANTLKNMFDGFVSLDTKWIYTSVNEKAGEMFGQKPDDLIGKHIWTEFPEGIDQPFYKKYYKAVETQEEISFEDFYVPWNRWFENHIIPSLDGLAIFFQDITERKLIEIELANQNEEYQSINEELRQTIQELHLAKEKAEESDRLKSAFLANMSHEIRTPMNGIVGFAKLMQNQDLTKEKLENYIKIIVNSSNQLLSIVNDILDISRIETGQVDLYEVKVNLNETLDEIKSFFELKASEKGIKLNLLKDLENTDSDILIDDSKLKQILYNLIGNALKFTHKGSIDFGYKMNNDEINFYVQDTGIGISVKNQKSIFNRFHKVVQKKDQLYGGTGLGLAICKGLAERMSGEIWVESKLKEGSRFFITLPYKKTKTPKEEYKIVKEDVDFLKFNILIVEDEEFNAFYLKELLKKKNINTKHVWNGEDAVKLCLNTKDIDLVLMDIKLPKMSGLEATRKIKETKPNLPIIAQTAYAMKSDEVEALQAGCDAYISKPIEEERLMGLLEKYLKN